MTPSILEQKNFLFTALEHMPVGVWIQDERGTIVYGNKEGQAIWSGARYVDPKDFGVYKGWWVKNGQLIKPEEWAAARAISRGETSVNEEIEIECFDGTHKFILNSAYPVRDSAGTVIGSVIINQDITPLKKQINEVQELNAMMVGRELKMVELKKEIDDLKEQLRQQGGVLT